MRSPEYVVHGTSSLKDTSQIFKDGFIVQSGRAVVSADLILGYEWALNPSYFVSSKSQDESGSILIMRVPDNLYVGYAIKTGITVDKDKKLVSGYVGRHRYSRRQLALYSTEGKNQTVMIPPSDIILNIQPSDELGEILNGIKRKTKDFKEVDRQQAQQSIIEVISQSSANFISENLDISSVINAIVATTIETTLINRIRSLSLDMRLANGYVFDDLRHDREIEPVQKDELVRLMERYRAVVNSQGFGLGDKLLVRYIKFFINRLAEESNPSLLEGTDEKAER